MTLARLHLTLPDGSWVADVSREYPEATFRVLAAMPGSDAGFGLVSVVAADLDPVLDSMGDHETLGDIDVMQRSDGEATVQFDTSRPLILLAAKRSGLPIEPPFHIEDGTATVDLVGGRDRLSEFGRQLDNIGIEYDVESVTRRRHTDQVLTDTQQELIFAAIELGYYDTPRECTLTELADHVGIAKSTCSETLQRAESRLIKRFIDKIPGEKPVEVPV